MGELPAHVGLQPEDLIIDPGPLVQLRSAKLLPFDLSAYALDLDQPAITQHP
jgi:hypothetical protein